MKFKITTILCFFFLSILASCQTNTPENLAASQYEESEFTKAAIDAEKDFILTRNGLNNQQKYPWFLNAYKSYKPEEIAINELQEQKEHLSFVVFGGSWCSDTKKALPKFYKVVEEAQIPNNKIALYGVDHEKRSQEKAVKGKTKSDEYDITRVPVFIVFYDGKEIGRLNEKPQKSLEEDMLKLIKVKTRNHI
jgi:thiol-disulfide isomerase/thioredoxin